MLEEAGLDSQFDFVRAFSFLSLVLPCRSSFSLLPFFNTSKSSATLKPLRNTTMTIDREDATAVLLSAMGAPSSRSEPATYVALEDYQLGMGLLTSLGASLCAAALGGMWITTTFALFQASHCRPWHARKKSRTRLTRRWGVLMEGGVIIDGDNKRE